MNIYRDIYNTFSVTDNFTDEIKNTLISDIEKIKATLEDIKKYKKQQETISINKLKILDQDNKIDDGLSCLKKISISAKKKLSCKKEEKLNNAISQINREIAKIKTRNSKLDINIEKTRSFLFQVEGHINEHKELVSHIKKATLKCGPSDIFFVSSFIVTCEKNIEFLCELKEGILDQLHTFLFFYKTNENFIEETKSILELAIFKPSSKEEEKNNALFKSYKIDKIVEFEKKLPCLSALRVDSTGRYIKIA